MIKVEFDMLSIWYFKLCERMSLFTESFHFGLLSEDRKKMSQSERERYREESRLRIDNYRRTCTELSTIAEQSEHSQFGQSLRRKDYSSLFTEADFAHLGRKSKSIQAKNAAAEAALRRNVTSQEIQNRALKLSSYKSYPVDFMREEKAKMLKEEEEEKKVNDNKSLLINLLNRKIFLSTKGDDAVNCN